MIYEYLNGKTVAYSLKTSYPRIAMSFERIWIKLIY
jgi:hypothetical protein